MVSRALLLLIPFCFTLTISVASKAADADDWLIRLRALAIQTNANGTSDEMGGSVRTGDDLIPEIDITYYLADDISVETMFGIAEYNVQLDDSALGNVDVGTVKKLPATVTIKYHINQFEDLIPYFGIGASYTIFFDEDVGRNINNIDYSNEFGFVFQIGLDYNIADNTYINLDMKKFIIDADMRMNNSSINANSVSLNPLMIGIGVGYKF
tara:strand:- start:678 stop:1310 length:633 start_codon:yes stop_codon:yes gene_type:complete